MANKGENTKLCKKWEGNENLLKLFTMLKKRESLVIVDKKTHFKSTELRLMSEILAAKREGKRLISTQLAKLLGVTRSAVSQIVNHLEAEGVVRRVADDVDKKIAYIEISESVLELYGNDLNDCCVFVDSLVAEFGKEKFDEMYRLYNDFLDLMQERLGDLKKRK